MKNFQLIHFLKYNNYFFKKNNSLNIIYLKEREELLDKKSKELSEIDREKDDNIKNLSNNEEKLDKILQEDYNLEKGE